MDGWALQRRRTAAGSVFANLCNRNESRYFRIFGSRILQTAKRFENSSTSKNPFPVELYAAEVNHIAWENKLIWGRSVMAIVRSKTWSSLHQEPYRGSSTSYNGSLFRCFYSIDFDVYRTYVTIVNVQPSDAQKSILSIKKTMTWKVNRKKSVQRTYTVRAHWHFSADHSSTR